MQTPSRIKLHQGTPPDEFSMPTCAVCRRQISRSEVYASVLTVSGQHREVRHNTEFCLRYAYGVASALVVGALIHTHRFMLTEWGGVIPGVIVERTEEFGDFGWRAYMIAPESADLMAAAIEKFRTHREASFRKMAETMAVDMTPQKVFISDGETTHYVLPS